MTRIIANMVVRNESDNYLIPVLERLSGQVDEIVITDDASTDNTADIASRFTETIQVLDKPMFSTNEGHLRQASWKFLEEAANPTPDDVILAIDADEMLYETEYSLREIVERKEYHTFAIQFKHMWSPTHYRVDGGWRPNVSTRMFRYQPNGVFRDRKMACGSEPTYVAHNFQYFRAGFLMHTGLVMQHLSYIKDEDKRVKYERYMDLDKGDFHAKAHIESIIDPIEEVDLREW